MIDTNEDSPHPGPSPELMTSLRWGEDCHCCQPRIVYPDRTAHDHTDFRKRIWPSAPFLLG